MHNQTLYLNMTNFGSWAQYRKKCILESEKKTDFCKKLHQILFTENLSTKVKPKN